MSARWPAFTSSPKGAKLDNEKSHAHLDPNKGGGPAAPVVRNAKHVPNASRGGPYQSGQRQYSNTSIRGTSGSAGNPATRGSTPIAMSPDMNNPNPGGAPAMTSAIGGDYSARGGSLSHGQEGVPGGHQTGVPAMLTKPGNTGGRMHRRIAGNFTNKTKGVSGSKGTVGSYGKAF